MNKQLNAYEITLVALLKADLQDKATAYFDSWNDQTSEGFMFYVRKAMEEIEREERMEVEKELWERERTKREREEWWEFMC